MQRHHQPRALVALASTAVLALAVTACGSDSGELGSDDPDVEVVATDAAGAVDSVVEEADDEVNDLAATLRDEGLDSAASIVEQIDVEELVGDEDFTFFAPSDEAFTSLSADDMADLLSDPQQILDTLRNHVLDGTVSADELVSMDTVETASDESLEVAADGDTVTIDGVAVVTTDIEVAGGVVHVVDGFLITS